MAVEVVLAHAFGICEIYYGGASSESSWELRTDAVVRTESAGETTEAERLYGILDAGKPSWAMNAGTHVGMAVGVGAIRGVMAFAAGAVADALAGAAGTPPGERHAQRLPGRLSDVGPVRGRRLDG